MQTLAIFSRPAAWGRQYALPTGRFQAAEFHWPLSSDEFEVRTDAARPIGDLQPVASVAAASKLERTFESPARQTESSANSRSADRRKSNVGYWSLKPDGIEAHVEIDKMKTRLWISSCRFMLGDRRLVEVNAMIAVVSANVKAKEPEKRTD
ncbi:hypothetical protein [Paraburkholderia sp. RAU2J]|uniref:hypothetical protein n=1 Tax=Paraburkholderia sp. RAU2J TaxID=1938810 RepID=UPI000EAC895E|nr:hypothetical protein [Paraburkholderia sp. RAU2J]